jgi:hypothetical protein
LGEKRVACRERGVSRPPTHAGKDQGGAKLSKALAVVKQAMGAADILGGSGYKRPDPDD